MTPPVHSREGVRPLVNIRLCEKISQGRVVQSPIKLSQD